MNPVARFVSAGGVDCDGCGSLITDGIFCAAWDGGGGHGAHYCDDCWARTGEFPNGAVGTITAEELAGPRPEWVRLMDYDGVPFFCEPDRR